MVTRRFVLSLLIPAFGVLPAAFGQFVQQGNKLVDAGADLGCQGISVAISADGNTAIVGAECGNDVGAALIYVRTNGGWSRQGPKLVGSGADGNAQQGASVAISADGNTVIVGGPFDTPLPRIGAAWVFTRTNGVWTQQGPKLVGSDSIGFAFQGSSVAISGDGNTALVGGPSDNNSGATWVFTRSNGVWSQQGAKLVGSGAVGLSAQGSSVALSADGNTAVAGGPNDNSGKGAAWVYVRANQAWSQQGGKLVGTGSINSPARQGSSVALSADGNTAIVGGPFDNDYDQQFSVLESFAGAAWVFVRNFPSWSQQGGKLKALGAVGSERFGLSAALSANGDIALVGGPHESLGMGAAWPYFRTNGLWSQGSKLVGTGGVGGSFIGGSFQGDSVSLSGDGNTAFVGGPFDNNGTGAAWAFTRTGIFFAVSTPPTTTSGAPFNFTVTAKDTNNSTLTGYTGIVHFTSTDPLAVLPADAMLINGVGTFQATLRNATPSGTQSITATDTANPSLTGTSATQVLTSLVTQFRIVPLSPVTAGVPFAFNIMPVDRFGNTTFDYSGRVRFTSSDPAAVLPPEEVAFTAIAILRTVGNQTITVTDTQNPSITGTSDAIPVAANSSTNLARGKTATQSSSLPGYTAGGPGAAVDGVTDGNFFNGSVTHTNLENNPWWQVDLGASSTISAIVIWNRTDCCGSRLSDYWVFASDTPFGPGDTPATLQNRPGTFGSHQIVVPNAAMTITPGIIQGRYVRVQLSSAGYLSLAEVQVTPNAPQDWNRASGKPSTQSSTLPGTSANANLAVDGNTDGNFYNGSVTHTDLDTEPWWQVDLGFTVLLDAVMIYNRTDCCGSRLSDYYIFVSNTPFSPADTISALQGRQGTSWFHQTAAPNSSVAIPLPASGRYIRIQAPGRNYLSLGEVQVSGTPFIVGEANPGEEGARR